MLTTYEKTVAEAIVSFANAIESCAADLEEMQYAVEDSLDSIQFIIDNYAQHDNANSLANAALASTLDTVVRENIHAYFAD